MNDSLRHLLSTKRLESYDGCINKHYANLRLIGKITSKIATLEIILRNKLDSVLSLKDKHWIENAKDEKIIYAKNKIASHGNETLSHHQYLSRMSLGIIIHIIKKTKTQDKIMHLNKIDFLDYDSSNRNFWKKDEKKVYFKNFEKVDIVLSLFQNIRNRSYHWENIMKVVEKNSAIYPRLTTKSRNTHIEIHPNKIENFLEDLIGLYNKEILDYC